MHETDMFPTPAQVDEAVSLAISYRTADGPFEVSVPIVLSSDRPANRQLVRDYESAGTTWLQVSAFSLKDLRAQIAAGPPAG